MWCGSERAVIDCFFFLLVVFFWERETPAQKINSRECVTSFLSSFFFLSPSDNRMMILVMIII